MTDISYNSIARSHRTGVSFVMAAAIAWSTGGFFTRLIGLDYPAMIAGRGIFGAMGLFVLILVTEKQNWAAPFLAMRWPSLVYFIFSVVCMTCSVGSLGMTSVAHNAVIFATLPLMAGFLGWLLLGEKPSLQSVIAAFVAVIGVSLMVGFGGDGGLWGDLLAGIATLLMTLCIILIRKYAEIPIIPCTCLASLFSGVLCLPFGDFSQAQPVQMLYLVLFGLVNSAAGLSLFSLGSRRLPAMKTALISSLDAPLAILWVWLAFHEATTSMTLIGCVIVLVAVLGNVVFAGKAHH